jgi:hypothetical protein
MKRKSQAIFKFIILALFIISIITIGVGLLAAVLYVGWNYVLCSLLGDAVSLGTMSIPVAIVCAVCIILLGCLTK